MQRSSPLLTLKNDGGDLVICSCCPAPPSSNVSSAAASSTVGLDGCVRTPQPRWQCLLLIDPSCRPGSVRDVVMLPDLRVFRRAAERPSCGRGISFLRVQAHAVPPSPFASTELCFGWKRLWFFCCFGMDSWKCGSPDATGPQAIFLPRGFYQYGGISITRGTHNIIMQRRAWSERLDEKFRGHRYRRFR